MNSLKQPHSQQRSAAEKIESIFAAGRIHYCFLNADVQSGKTGCFQTVIRNMLAKSMIDRAYILCGSTETELYEQARADTLAYNADYADKITVIFRQDFPKHALNVERALIVVDESHMDQSTDHKLAEYLAKYGLAMDGTRPIMLDKKTYILSVDATGYSEICAIRRGLSRSKAIVDLEAGVGYWGPAQYYHETFWRPGGAKLLQPTFDLWTGAARFQSLFKPATWNLMRLPGGKKEQKAAFIAHIRTICDRVNVKVYLFNGSREDVQISRLSDPPPAGTHAALVLLDGRLRAGKVVPKRHIGFVWEGAKSSNTDAVVQGLLGRMCGYDFGAEKPIIFLPADSLEHRDKKLVKLSEIERHIRTHQSDDSLLFWENTDEPMAVPAKATNIVAGKNPKALEGVHRCPPLRIQLGEDAEWAEGRTDRTHMKMLCLDVLRENLGQISGHTQLSEEQKAEILDEIRRIAHHDEETTLRHIRADSSESQRQYTIAMLEAHNNKQIPLCHSTTDPRVLNFVVIHPDARLPGLRAGDVLVDLYTKASGPLSAKPTETMFGSVEKGCAFVERVLAVPTTAAASVAVGISTQQLATPEVFKTALHSFIRRRIEDAEEGFAVTPTLQFHPEHRTFQKSQFWYRSPNNNHVRTILNEIGESLGIVCKLRFVRGSTNARTTFQVDSISWKGTYGSP